MTYFQRDRVQDQGAWCSNYSTQSPNSTKWTRLTYSHLPKGNSRQWLFIHVAYGCVVQSPPFRKFLSIDKVFDKLNATSCMSWISWVSGAPRAFPYAFDLQLSPPSSPRTSIRTCEWKRMPMSARPFFQNNSLNICRKQKPVKNISHPNPLFCLPLLWLAFSLQTGKQTINWLQLAHK